MEENVISRQTFKGSLYSYIGAIIGFVNVALLMPMYFSTAEIGLTNILVSVSSVFGQLGTLGFMNVTAKLFPKFRDKQHKHNGFGFLITSVGAIGFILCLIGFFISENFIIERNIDKSPLIVEYIYLLIPFIFISLFYILFDIYNRILFNASFGLFVKEFLLRIFNFVGIILFCFQIFDFKWFIYYYTIVYGSPILLIWLLLIYKKDFSLKPDFKIFREKPELKKEILSVAFWGLIAGFAGSSIFSIDKIIISEYYKLDDVGVYSTMFFFGSMIMVAGRSMTRISGSVIAESFKNNDHKKIEDVYKNTVISMTIIGVLFFIGIWGNIDNILQILKPEYANGKYVILFVGLGHLVQMIAGTSGEIINYGKYYRHFTIIMIILILMIISLNIWFLPIFGITGSGIALLISYTIYFFIRFFFIKIKYKFQPYNCKFWLILLFGTISYLISLLIPHLYLYLDIFIRSLTIFLLFIIPLYFFKVSPEKNRKIIDFCRKIFKRKI